MNVQVLQDSLDVIVDLSDLEVYKLGVLTDRVVQAFSYNQYRVTRNVITHYQANIKDSDQ